jgi:carbamoyl-phosphate synthase small subunit
MDTSLSNGPGDPRTENTVRLPKYFTTKTTFRNLLGHQVGLANGISTYKMFNGHRGINHPVMNVLTGKEKLLLKIMVLLSTEKNLKKHNDLELRIIISMTTLLLE